MQDWPRSLALSAAMLLAGSGCSDTRDDIAEKVETAMPSQAAIEVFSALIPPSSGKHPVVGCLSIEGEDAPKAVMDALVERHRHAVPASRCHPGTNTPDGVQQIAHALSGFKRYGDTAAEVEGTSYAGPLAASGTLFDLELSAGKWRISRQDMLWISRECVSRDNSNKV